MIGKVVAVSLGAFLAMTLGIWVSDRTPPTVVFTREVMNPVIQPGEVLKIRFVVRRFKSCAVDIERWMIDGAGTRIPLEGQSYRTPPGPIEEDKFISPVPTPRTMEQGLAQYHTKSYYSCNPVHRIFWPIQTSYSVSFIVQGEPVPLINSLEIPIQ